MRPVRLARKLTVVMLAYVLLLGGLLGAVSVRHDFDPLLQTCVQDAGTSGPRREPDAPAPHATQDCCLAACLAPVAVVNAGPVVIAPAGERFHVWVQSARLLRLARAASSKLARAPPVG